MEKTPRLAYDIGRPSATGQRPCGDPERSTSATVTPDAGSTRRSTRPARRDCPRRGSPAPSSNGTRPHSGTVSQAQDDPCGARSAGRDFTGSAFDRPGKGRAVSLTLPRPRQHLPQVLVERQDGPQGVCTGVRERVDPWRLREASGEVRRVPEPGLPPGREQGHPRSPPTGGQGAPRHGSYRHATAKRWPSPDHRDAGGAPSVSPWM
jgi:hypothetical protein